MVRSSFPILYVDDVLASVRFYRDLLGFEEIYRFPDSDEPGYVSLQLDDGKIGLSNAEFPGIHGKPQRPVTGRPFELCIEVADVDAFVSELRTGGVMATRCTSAVRWRADERAGALPVDRRARILVARPHACHARRCLGPSTVLAARRH